MKIIIRICSLLFCFQSFSQTVSNQEKIRNYIETYFYYDREIIHVDFNKNIYANNEDLAFKGYVWSKNSNMPHANTTNMELVIYNEQQEIVQRQLLFTNKGTFTGGIHLNNKFKAGKYYFHFYTNWMNNFKEDDSFTQEIEIIDINQPYNFKTKEPNWKNPTITIYPEGGSIISDINNTIGVNIKDCNKKGIETDGIVLDSKSNEVSHFHTNKMGNGAFYFIPKNNEIYILKIKTDKLTASQILPKVQETGIIVTYNNLSNNKLIVDVKTNEKGVELYQDKKFVLLFQQNGNFSQKEITFKNKANEQPLLLDKGKLPTGVNSIRLIDEDLNEISERLLYIYAEKAPITTLEAKPIADDSILLSGKTEAIQADLSMSVLPEKNVCVNQNRSIIGTFYLNAYLENPEIDNYSYYNPENSDGKRDMELLMLNQNKSKFLWDNIKSEPKKITYTFEKGVTISGKVEKKLEPNSKYKISLVSFKDNLFDQTPVDQNNDFKFENYIAKDSTVYVLQMVNEKGISKASKIEAKIPPYPSNFVLPFQFNQSCPAEKKQENAFTFNAPQKENVLKEVIILNNSKTALTHQSSMSGNASAYKITEKDFEKVLNFIGRHGYRTGVTETNDVFIRSNRNFDLSDSSGSPAVYIDDIQLLDLNFIFNLTLNDVDEIYIDESGASDITTTSHGTIKIYLRDQAKKRNYNVKFSSLIVTRGFTQDIQYKNSLFETPNEFSYFGTLNWTPNIAIKDNPNYEIKFPNDNQKEIQVLLQGFSQDGQLISEIKKIPISSTQ